MTTLKSNCPSCGGPIEFTAGSTIVLVCPFCRSAVARTDRGLQDLGKVAEIAETEGHHPDIHLTEYKYVMIVLTTHAIEGLSNNDFIMAAKIDAK